MPSKSKPQARFFAMLAHHPDLAKRRGVPLATAKEFNDADQRTGILKKKKQTGGNAANAGQ